MGRLRKTPDQLAEITAAKMRRVEFNENNRRYAVFHGNGNHPLEPFLKRGFKHCFCVVENDGYFISVDGLMGQPEVKVLCGSDYDLEGFYAREGYTVVSVGPGANPNVPIILSNCVGMVKAILGINAATIFTPYQLYRSLIK